MEYDVPEEEYRLPHPSNPPDSCCLLATSSNHSSLNDGFIMKASMSINLVYSRYIHDCGFRHWWALGGEKRRGKRGSGRVSVRLGGFEQTITMSVYHRSGQSPSEEHAQKKGVATQTTCNTRAIRDLTECFVIRVDNRDPRKLPSRDNQPSRSLATPEHLETLQSDRQNSHNACTACGPQKVLRII